MLSIFQTKSSDAIPQMTIMGSRKAPLSVNPLSKIKWQALLHPRGSNGQFIEKGTPAYVQTVAANIIKGIGSGTIPRNEGVAALRKAIGNSNLNLNLKGVPKPKAVGFGTTQPTGAQQLVQNLPPLPRKAPQVGSVGGSLGFTAKPPSPNKAKSFIDNAKNAIVTKFNQAKAQRIAANKQQQAADRQRRLAQKKLADRQQQAKNRAAINQTRLAATRAARKFNRTEDMLGRTTYTTK